MGSFLWVLLPYKTIMFALLSPGVIIFSFTAFQARSMQQQIIDDRDIINRCYAVLNNLSNPPVADALEECQQVQEITSDQEGFLGFIYVIMIVGGILIASGAIFGFSYSRRVKVSAK